ncbi:MAG TPA: hypothetical protein VFE71_00130 [Bacteroidales bacterium]|nr:hypothetical protein [Bacteroidales bacterium]
MAISFSNSQVECKNIEVRLYGADGYGNFFPGDCCDALYGAIVRPIDE